MFVPQRIHTDEPSQPVTEIASHFYFAYITEGWKIICEGYYTMNRKIYY
jgi:hypothetical protein